MIIDFFQIIYFQHNNKLLNKILWPQRFRNGRSKNQVFFAMDLLNCSRRSSCCYITYICISCPVSDVGLLKFRWRRRLFRLLLFLERLTFISDHVWFNRGSLAFVSRSPGLAGVEGPFKRSTNGMPSEHIKTLTSIFVRSATKTVLSRSSVFLDARRSFSKESKKIMMRIPPQQQLNEDEVLLDVRVVVV